MKVVTSLALITVILLSLASQGGYTLSPEPEVAKKAKKLISITENILEYLEATINITRFTSEVISQIISNLTSLKEKLKEAKSLYGEGKYEDALRIAREVMEIARELCRAALQTKEIAKIVKERVEEVEELGKREYIKRVTEMLETLAKRTNTTRTMAMLNVIKEMMKEGNVTNVGKVISEVAKEIKLKSRKRMSERIIKNVKEILKKENKQLSKAMKKGAKEDIKGIDVAISKIMETIERLKEVIEHLKETNASSVAISAIEMIIAHLESIVDHLESVKEHIKKGSFKTFTEKIISEMPGKKREEEVEKEIEEFIEKVKDTLEDVEEFIKKAYEKVPEELRNELGKIFKKFTELRDAILKELEKEEIDAALVLELLDQVNSLKEEVMELLKETFKPEIKMTDLPHKIVVKSGAEFKVKFIIVNLVDASYTLTIKVIDEETGETIGETEATLDAYGTYDVSISLKAPEVKKTITWEIKIVCYYNGEEVKSEDIEIIVKAIEKGQGKPP